MPFSWEPVAATTDLNYFLGEVAWSPCNRFIAVTGDTQPVEVLDAVTLSRIGIFEHSSKNVDQQLGFSPDSHCLMQFAGGNLISWDLQTGGPLGAICSGPKIPYMKPFSFTHSEDGKVVAVVYKSWNIDHSNDKCTTSIYTYNLLSGTHMGHHQILDKQVICPVWTHNECFQFATIDPGLIRVWESPFTLEHPPTEVKALPIPCGVVDAGHFLFFPALSRLAFTLGESIQIWDAEASKLLLKSKFKPAQPFDTRDPPKSSFSSNGCLFACVDSTREVYVWKESPTGYVFHQQLPFFTSPSPAPGPLLSPNGKSIIVPINSGVCRLHLNDHVLPPPSISAGNIDQNPFILGFSPDGKFAAFVQKKGKMITILDLQSGEKRWITNMGVQSDCLGIAGNTVIVVGEEKIVTWDLPGQDCISNPSINDGVQTTVLSSSPFHIMAIPTYMSISPDLSHIVVARASLPGHCSLEVDDVSTGRCLAKTETNGVMRPQFTPDGHEFWAWNGDSFGDWCEIIRDSGSGTIKLELQSVQDPSQLFFQESSCGHKVTDGGWIMSSTQKRLLWLPHHWRSDEQHRIWSRQFLGLLHGGLPEVVILEFFE